MNKSASDIKLNHVEKDNLVRLVFLFVLILWGFWIAVGVFGWIKSEGRENYLERFGQFGDLFGSLNAIFTALAFVAVWWTGRMQRQELILQRTELSFQRKELELQRDEQKATRFVVSRQTFESMFFRLLTLTRELHDAIEYIGGSRENPWTGKQALKGLREQCEAIVNSVYTVSRHDVLSNISRHYDGDLYIKYEPHLGPYFRSLYHVFKLVSEQRDLDEETRAYYAKIARAQLSGDDLVLLALNGCAVHGVGFVRYIEDYQLLKHLPNTAYKKRMEELYAPSAFGNKDEQGTDAAAAVRAEVKGRPA